MIVYHGTAFKFDKFDGSAAFFTLDFEAAAAYALNCEVPEDEEYEMAVLAVEVDEARLEEFRKERFHEVFGDDGRHASESWAAAGEYAHEVAEKGEFIGILIRDCMDYAGKDFKSGKVFERRYDQVVIAQPERLEILQRIPISENFKIHKDIRHDQIVASPHGPPLRKNQYRA